MPSVKLKEVTEENWLEAIALSVQPEQERFVPSAAISLAKAYVKPGGEMITPFGIYSDGRMAGFFVCIFDPESTDNYWISGFLIDHKHQGRGIGKAAMKEILAQLPRFFPKCQKIGLTVLPDNHNARKLYESTGFVDTGRLYEGEIVYRMEL